MDANGTEYVIDGNANKTVSVIVRKSPNILTFIQRTPQGVTLFDLSEAGKAALMSLLAGEKPEPEPVGEQILASADQEAKRRGRPPKSTESLSG